MPNVHLFAGERFNADTGLVYLRSRWMDPRVGLMTFLKRFEAKNLRECQQFTPPDVDVIFTPIGRTTSTLDVIRRPEVILQGGHPGFRHIRNLEPEEIQAHHGRTGRSMTAGQGVHWHRAASVARPE